MDRSPQRYGATKMNALFKLRPGLFGLLFAAIAISSFSTAIGKAPRPTARPQGDVYAATAPDNPGATVEPAIEPVPEQAST